MIWIVVPVGMGIIKKVEKKFLWGLMYMKFSLRILKGGNIKIGDTSI